MTQRLLSVTWFNRQLSAAVCQGGFVKASWKCDRPIDHVGEWGPALREALDFLNYRGAEAVVVLDHRQLVYHLQDAPPGSLRTLRPFLQRKVVQSAFYDEAAAWSFHHPTPLQGGQRFLLTALPLSVLQGLNDVCAELGLDLTGVFSPAGVLAWQFKRLHLQPSESALLVSDLGGSLCLVAGRGDGQILFCRHLAGLGAPNALRAGQEINRTLLFIHQQFGLAIDSLWVFGDSLFEWLSTLTIREGLAIRRSPVEDTGDYYAAAASLLPALHSANLISESVTRQRLRRRRTAVGALALLLAAITVNLAVAQATLEHEADSAHLTRSWNQLEHYRDVLHFRQREINLLQDSLRQIGTTNDPPVLPLFIKYLAGALPDSIQLTGCAVSESQGVFSVRLEGCSQSANAPLLPQLEQLESALSQGLFRIEITDGTRRRIFGGSDLAAPSPAATLAPGLRPFFIEGHFQ